MLDNDGVWDAPPWVPPLVLPPPPGPPPPLPPPVDDPDDGWYPGKYGWVNNTPGQRGELGPTPRGFQPGGSGPWPTLGPPLGAPLSPFGYQQPQASGSPYASLLAALSAQLQGQAPLPGKTHAAPGRNRFLAALVDAGSAPAGELPWQRGRRRGDVLSGY